MFKEKVSCRLPRRRLQELFSAVVKGESRRRPRGHVNLIFTNDHHLHELNRKYRRIDRPTDVLSFNIDEPVDDESTFGEIYISTETARRQARDYAASLTEELLRLTCHGLLHLFGYDHERATEADVMRSRESRYLRSVGVGGTAR